MSGRISALLFTLFLRISSWVCSVPMWATLICHFVFGLSIFWFWLTLIAWLLVGVIHYLLIMFGRWGASASDRNADKPNKNPSSQKNTKL